MHRGKLRLRECPINMENIIKKAVGCFSSKL